MDIMWFEPQHAWSKASQVALVGKNPPANTGAIRDVVSVPGLGRFPGGRHGNPLQYSCLENVMDREAWTTVVHRVTKRQTWLKLLSMHTRMCLVQGHACPDYQIPLSLVPATLYVLHGVRWLQAEFPSHFFSSSSKKGLGCLFLLNIFILISLSFWVELKDCPFLLD